MNIFLFEVKFLRKNTCIWICSMIALAALYLSIYPSVAKDAADFRKLLGNYPPAVQAMLGINLDTIATVNGFYSMIFSFILLCGAVQAMNLGIAVFAKESKNRTSDFILVKPVSRTTILSAKLCASLTIIAVTNAVFLLAVVGMVNLFVSEAFDEGVFLLMNLSLLFIQLVFVGLGMVTAVFFKKLRNTIPLSLGVVFGFYLIGALLAVGKEEETLRFLSPFKYFDITYVLNHHSYEGTYLILSAAIILISIAVSYVVYNKKDIPTVS